MHRRFLPILLLLLCTPCFAHTVPAAGAGLPAPVDADAKPTVMLVEVHDTLQPEMADLMDAMLEAAKQQNVSAILLNFSSPGGFSDSTDRVVAAIRASPVPVIVFVTSQSRVSGQALRVLAAADVALMAPTAYLTPLWTDVPRGVTADQRSTASQALLLSLSDLLKEHGRDASAAEELSAGVHWFSAEEATQAGIVNGVAEKQADVLRFVTAKGYTHNGVHHTLALTGATVAPWTTGAQQSLLDALMNPNLCVLLCTLGLLLIYLEINTPGVILPGATGVLLVLLAGYSLSRLPLNTYGILLCLLAVLLLVLEAHFKLRGVLAGLGIVAVVNGLAMLVQGPLPQLQVHWSTAVGAGLGFGGITASLMLLGMEARRAKIRTGADAMLGWLGVAHTPLTPEGHILVRGELWRARLTSSERTVEAGEHVKVLRADGMTLEVTAVPLVTTT